MKSRFTNILKDTYRVLLEQDVPVDPNAMAGAPVPATAVPAPVAPDSVTPSELPEEPKKFTLAGEMAYVEFLAKCISVGKYLNDDDIDFANDVLDKDQINKDTAGELGDKLKEIIDAAYDARNLPKS